MDFVIERKEVSDLSASIMDGRYSEQKMRMEQCGLGRVMYIVEGDKPHKLSQAAVETAVHSTQVCSERHLCAQGLPDSEDGWWSWWWGGNLWFGCRLVQCGTCGCS
jgi:ERCC4-type nuclease